MLSQGNVIFFVAFVLGAFIFYLLKRWNDKKLTAEQLKEISDELTTSTSEIVLSLIIGIVGMISFQIQKLLGYEGLGMVFILCFLGILLLRGSIKKDICFAKLQIPQDYIRAERNIVSVASWFFIALGLIQFIIFLRSEFF